MLAIIPARGGSKGLPGKNVKPLGGKPLIYWTIEAAFNAKGISRVILSTDDDEIARICAPTGIEIPFMRPKELAQDDSLAIDNYIYTVQRLVDNSNVDIQEFAVFLPTTPFRTESDIDLAINIFHSNHADSVISCTLLAHPVDWILHIDEKSKILHTKMMGAVIMNRQASPMSYVPNGAIYIFKFDILKMNYSYYTKNSYAYIMPPERSIDIDTIFDFNFAEFIYTRNSRDAC
jgi:CMP-N,N'-diacetyllegionaminic acid synthase